MPRKTQPDREARVHEVDVGKLRARLGLTQEQFARAFGVKVTTLRNWEQRRVDPDGPAKVLLTLIEKDPRGVMEALGVG